MAPTKKRSPTKVKSQKQPTKGKHYTPNFSPSQLKNPNS